MAKDLIIGGISNYKYDDIKFWINSIHRTGFSGDIVLVATNMLKSELEKITQNSVEEIKILAYGQKDAEGNYTSNSQMPPHVERFFHIWNYLNITKEEYRYVITTDVRDVVFQSDPTKWIEENIGDKELIAAGEGLKYSDEPWNNNNYAQAFGPFFYQQMKDNEIYNVGIISGTHNAVRDLILLLLQLSINRPIPIVDQAVYNFVINIETFKNRTKFVSNDDFWAINLGTTLEAIKSGSGDIGIMMQNDPTAQILYRSKYLCDQPVIINNVIASPKDKSRLYTIVHQYDRVKGLDDKIRELYKIV